MSLTIARIRAVTISTLAGLVLAACASSQNATAPTATALPPTNVPAPTATALPPTSVPEPTSEPVVASPVAQTPAGPVADPEDEAAVALEQFLSAMHEGRYEDAAALYGGDYGILQVYNPTVPADDYAGLLRQACEVNGFKCMAPASITRNTSDANAIYYDVTFFAPDGSIFGIQTSSINSDVFSSFGLMVQMGPDGPRPITLPPFVS